MKPAGRLPWQMFFIYNKYLIYCLVGLYGYVKIPQKPIATSRNVFGCYIVSRDL